MAKDSKYWKGVDLDGTLAHYDEWEGEQNIGDPIPAMMKRVKQWIAEGETVKIMTARAGTPLGVKYVKKWLAKHGLGDLEVTNVKDYHMTVLYDDRAVEVIKNTGEFGRNERDSER